jgi:exosome complex component RRP4
MERSAVRRELVVPGQLLDSRSLKPGPGTYSDGGRIYASQLGIRSERGGFVSIIPLAGRYIPRMGDTVVGEIIDLGPSFWLVDLNSPYPATLHVTEVPWRVDFGDTARFLNVEEAILAQVANVDETKRVSVSMRDRSCRKLTGGQLVEISPTKVPRVIGKKGSMINLVKDYTKCKIFVGQNGRIWIDGDVGNMAICARVLRMIEERSQALGLTEAVKGMLEQAYGKRQLRESGKRDGEDGQT